MRNKLGIICMMFGMALLLAALSLFTANRLEEQRAAEAVDRLMPQLVQRIEENVSPPETTAEPETDATVTAAPDTAVPETNAPETLPVETALAAVTVPLLSEPVPKKMTIAVIDGYGYIGYLSLPTLDLALPVMDEWDYDRLRLAPCRFSGTTMEDDLVIAAHDYTRHFGRLEELEPGDAVQFTDMNGRRTDYTVAAVDVLAPTDVKDMTAGQYDLTLFTCTYDGKNRFTVRCNRVD